MAGVLTQAFRRVIETFPHQPSEFCLINPT